MNNAEARELLAQQLAPYRVWSYERLRTLVDAEPETREVVGPSGVTYQIELRAFWDGRAHGDVRMTAAIDDGGWRAFMPLGNSFIKAPDGSFVGE